MKTYGIYGCKDENGKPMYVGHSSLSLEQLEHNHRNYFKYKNGVALFFRQRLVKKGEKWTFGWIYPPEKMTQKEAKILEGKLIRLSNPKYNIDRYPEKPKRNK